MPRAARTPGYWTLIVGRIPTDGTEPRYYTETQGPCPVALVADALAAFPGGRLPTGAVLLLGGGA